MRTSLRFRVRLKNVLVSMLSQCDNMETRTFLHSTGVIRDHRIHVCVIHDHMCYCFFVPSTSKAVPKSFPSRTTSTFSRLPHLLLEDEDVRVRRSAALRSCPTT